MKDSKDPERTPQQHEEPVITEAGLPPEGLDVRAADPYRQLFEASADAILIIEDERFVDCNEAVAHMLGYSNRLELLKDYPLGSIIGTHPSEMSPPRQPDGRSSFEKANEMIAIAKANGSHLFEWNHRRRNGEVFPVEVQLVALETPEKKQVLHVVWRDISERKALEAQLRHSQKMEALGELSSGVAHDFNNLLVAVLCYCDLLEDRLDETDLLSFIQKIREAGLRGSELTHQLLALCRRPAMPTQVVDFRNLIDGLSPLLERTSGETIRLKIEMTEQNLPVRCDPGNLEQVVLNLVNNACDAIHSEGLVIIRAETASESECVAAGLGGGPALRFEVVDNGSGMEENVRIRAREPFFTTKDVGSGTGLGLTLVEGITRQMGGTMEIQSVQNEGTKISLFLPMASEPVKPSKPMPPRGEHRGCENILVVEDQVEVSELVSTVLERRGYSVEVAAHGREALERLNSKPNGFQLVLSDVVMPVMGGVELFRALRRQGVEIPILLMSGYVEDARALPALPGGDPPFLAKPFTAQGLLTAIRQLLDEKLEKTLP